MTSLQERKHGDNYFWMLTIRSQGIGFLVFSSETMFTLQETIQRVCVLFFFDAVVWRTYFGTSSVIRFWNKLPMTDSRSPVISVFWIIENYECPFLYQIVWIEHYLLNPRPLSSQRKGRSSGIRAVGWVKLECLIQCRVILLWLKSLGKLPYIHLKIWWNRTEEPRVIFICNSCAEQ